MAQCFLCDNEQATVNLGAYPHYWLHHVSCDVCGKYLVTQEAVDFVLNVSRFESFKPKLSAVSRERQVHQKEPIAFFTEEPNPTPTFPYGVIPSILSEFPDTVSERLDRTLLNFSKMSKYPGDKIHLEEKDYPIFFVNVIEKDKRASAFLYILRQLIRDGFIEGPEGTTGEFVVTPKGWSKVYDLEKGQNPESKNAFIAMWFGDEMGEAYENGFTKAIVDAGYKDVRIDRKEHNNDITDEIIAEIRRSKFVICDFTGQRGGVYFEAGFAMGLGIPVIWTCREDYSKSIHFDTRQFNHIFWSNPEELYTKLLNRIRATIV